MAFPVGGAVFLNISHALSEETLDFLCNVHDSPGLPEPDDIVGWSRLQELVERYALPEIGPVSGASLPGYCWILHWRRSCA